MKAILLFAFSGLLLFGNAVFGQDNSNGGAQGDKSKAQFDSRQFFNPTNGGDQKGVSAPTEEPPTPPENWGSYQFLAIPTSHSMPVTGSTREGAMSSELFEARMKHWLLIYNQSEFEAKYGALPEKLPNGYTPQEYSAHPPSSAFSDDYERFVKEQTQGKTDPAEKAQ